MNKNVIIVIVLVVLVLLTAVQAVQLESLKSQVKEGKVNIASSPSGAGSVPSSLDNLPNMVGGC